MKYPTIGVVMMVATASAKAGDVPYGGAPPPPYGPPPYAPAPPPPGPPPPPPYIYPWGGPYFGGNVGVQWASTVGDTSSSSITGGMQTGFNWQIGPWVYGVETDFNLSGASGRFADFQFSNPFFGTVRGRGGYTINTIFVYGTAGLAYSMNTIESSGLSDSSAHLGWTIGAGVEIRLAPWGFGPNWSAKAEYLYISSSQGVVLPASVSTSFESKVVRFGVNYHF
jgi:outer membrane immunogenic protein